MIVSKHFFLGVVLLLSIACKGQSKIEINPFGYDSTAYESVYINYTKTGRGDTTLLFIHGWNLNQSYWKEQVEEFSNSFQVVTVDLAGHGKSGKKRIHWTIESFARDIQTIIKQEKLKNIILVAHSMGGEIALEVATHFPAPIIGIIGVDNFKDVTLTITEQHRKGMDAYVKDFISNYPARAEAMAKENIVTKDTLLAQRIMDDYQKADPQIAVAVLMNLFPKAAAAKYKLMQLRFPLQIIMSDYAPYNQAGLERYCKKGYQIIPLAGTGHFPMVEQPKAFNQALKKCLSTR